MRRKRARRSSAPQGECAIDGCTDPAKTKGMCGACRSSVLYHTRKLKEDGHHLTLWKYRVMRYGSRALYISDQGVNSRGKVKRVSASEERASA